MNFKLTYATMFNPPAEMHTRFDAALAELNRSLGATHPLYINGEDRVTAKLPALQFYQLSLPTPKPPAGTNGSARSFCR